MNHILQLHHRSKTSFRSNLPMMFRFLSLPLALFFVFFCGAARAQNYTITTTPTTIVITDNSGNGETLDISESTPNIRFMVVLNTRTYSINGGAVTEFNTTPANVPLSGITSITVNAAGGNDVINVSAFAANLPSLTINGGTGSETVNLTGDITFAADANLDLDLQNDGGSPGTDALVVATNANLKLSGTGAATVKVSHYLAVNAGASIETVDGNLIAEANQQTTPSSGDFDGVYVDGANSKLACSGTGAVTVLGKSGTSSTSFGVALRTGGKISSNSGDITVIGTGGNSTAVLNYGVWVTGTNSAISSAGGNVNVTGTGGGSGAGSNGNIGVVVDAGATISSGGNGSVTLVGTGGSTSAGTNLGVRVQGTSASITSSAGNVSVTGTEGGGASGLGIVTASPGTITSTSGGAITLNAKSMDIGGTVNTSGSVTLRGPDNIQINLGTATNTIGGPIGLTDAELDRVTGTSIIIGHAVAGNITVSAAIAHATSTNMSLVSGGDVLISGGGVNTGGGTLLLDPGTAPAAVKPTFTATDATCSTLSFGSDLAIVVNGPVVNTDYNQLNVAGAVDLTGVDLSLQFGYAITSGTSFDILAASSVSGTIGTVNISNTGAGNVSAANVTYPGGNTVRVTVTTPLAVELAGFSGKKVGDNVQLDWQTASETNNRGFEIERSADGFSWQNIGFENGKGTTTDRSDYSFLDEKPLAGQSFYRLRQMDFDGKSDLSNVVSVNRKSGKGATVAPNPASADSFFSILFDEKSEAEAVTVRLFDAAGRLVKSQILSNETRRNISTDSLAPGLFWLEIEADGERFFEKILVQ